MSCAFDLDHYVEILGAASSGGYRFAAFGEDPAPGDLFLRHDVDLSLQAALRLAELEAELDISSWYFVMTESVFYNLASREGVAALDRLRALGHRVGLHAVYPNARLDHRFEPFVSWHNAEPAWMTLPIDGAVNVMGGPYFDPRTYRSDSNQCWRSGCPHEQLQSRSFPWLHLLIHAEIWVYEGASMGRTMRAMLAAETERRLEQLREDRIDLS